MFVVLGDDPHPGGVKCTGPSELFARTYDPPGSVPAAVGLQTFNPSGVADVCDSIGMNPEELSH
jgi:hypothetical protein